MRVIISDLFSPRLRHGVFQMGDLKSLQDLKGAASTKDYVYLELNGLEIMNGEQFLAAFERESACPFKLNWDAFESELKSVRWITESGIVIIYHDFQVFQQSDPEGFQLLLSIVHSVIQVKKHRIRSRQSLYFVFYSESEIMLPPVELLTPYLVERF